MTETRRLRAALLLLPRYTLDTSSNTMQPFAAGAYVYLSDAWALLSEPQEQLDEAEADAVVATLYSCGEFPLTLADKVNRVLHLPVLPAPPEADKWTPFAPAETDGSTTNSGDIGNQPARRHD